MNYRRVIGLLLCALVLKAGDVAVLVDVSGSMRSYGNWQPDALAFVGKVLEGSVPPGFSQWEQLGDSSSLADFVLNAGVLHVIRFGSSQGNSFPYFTGTEKIPLADLQSTFPLSPDTFQQPRTNKSLAQAVGARLAGTTGMAHLIIVSDFLIDADLTDAEQEFVNQFESTTQIETPLIYSWRANQHVLIKLLRVRLSVPGTPSGMSGGQSAQEGTIHLLSATVLTTGRGVQFRWGLTSHVPAKYYQVVVRDLKSHQVVFKRSRILGESLAYADPPFGHLNWQVTATLENDATLTSPVGTVVVPGTNPMHIMLALLLAAGVVYLAYYLRRRRNQQKRATAPQ